MTLRLVFSLSVFLACTTTMTAMAAPTLEEIWNKLQAQEQLIGELQESLEVANQRLKRAETRNKIVEENLNATSEYVENITQVEQSKTTIGGYGELHYNNLDANDSSRDLKQADFHRWVLFFGHKFNDRISFFSEFELEHSLAIDTADGSGPGEVELEQAYLDYKLNDNHSVRAGQFLIPIGIMNETHEPPTFYGVERNDVENIIIPATWWEAGVAASGNYANGLSWDFAVHTGLEMPTTGGSAYRVRSGRQKVAKAVAEDLAYTLRVRYSGVPGLDVAATFQHQGDASQVSDDGLDSGRLTSLHGIYTNGPFSIRGLWAKWEFDGTGVNTAGVEDQDGWYLEPSFRFDLTKLDLGLYARFEEVEGARTRDQFDQWEFGVNVWPTDKVVLKADYRNRSHNNSSDQGRDFKGIDLGIGYQF